MVLGGAISLKSHNSGFTCRRQKRCSLFYSSSKVLSDDVSLLLLLLSPKEVDFKQISIALKTCECVCLSFFCLIYV